MGTYKVGDKFVIEIEDVDEYGCYIKDFGVVTNHHVLDRLPQLVNGVDMASYNKGMEDAWELARKYYDMATAEIKEATGLEAGFYEVIDTLIVHEAKEKLEAWENKIRFGDEVENVKGPTIKIIVTDTWHDGGTDYIYGISRTGEHFSERDATSWRKTGNNYAAELRELLDKIGGESE